MSALLVRIAALALLIGWCFALLVTRIVWSGTATYAFLVWNIFLASVPVLAAVMFCRAIARNASRAVISLWGCAWLAFLPNAPYIVTDFVHLRPRSFVPVWYDVVLLLSCAVTGILLGFVSVAEVHRVARKTLGEVMAWLAVGAVFFLSAFGIYLGRFLRWNSWQIITDPWLLLADVITQVVHPLSHPRTVAVTVIYGVALCVGYAVFYLFSIGRDENRRCEA